MSRNKLRLVYTFLIAFIVVGFSLNSVTAAPNGKSGPQSVIDPESTDTFKQLTLFSDVLERTRSDYVDPVTDEKLIESAINGMLSSLDPHSGYLNKKSFQDMQTQTKGEFGGLGIEVTLENSLIKVVSPIDDTPAAKAGIQPNDLITHIDSKLVTELTLNEAVDRMRGTPGTKVTLTLRRGGISGHPFEVTMTRAIIKIQSVKWEIKQNVVYLRITTFNEQTQIGLDKALAESSQKIGDKLEGYVIDLRNNPGGLLDQAVSVTGSFIEAGKEVVSTRGRHKEEDQSFVAKGGDRTHGKPITVLINGGSASASEIVAGALQDHRRAIVLGTKSFGKGSVQTIIPVAGAGAMRLTTARYYTPSGRSIQQLGIEPDIMVMPAKVEEVAMGKGISEADLRGALENDTMSKDQKKKDKKDREENSANSDASPKEGDAGKDDKKKAPVDYQLERSLDLIHGLYLFDAKNQKAPSPTEEAKK
ncbi:MAG: S41 family peptidase [Alphaproteobacteria bacterium]|nr:S41 family peptidase [Alphaproteobacteria bacterium]